MADDEKDYIMHGPPSTYVSQQTGIGKFIFDCLREDPEFIGQIEAHTGHRYTYAEILDRSIRFALWLRDMEVKPGDVVAYVTSNHRDVVVVLYATFFVGAVISPWDPTLTIQEITYLMDSIKPTMVICSEDAATKVKKAAEDLNVSPTFVVHGELSGFVAFADTQIRKKTDIDHFQCTEVAEDDVALMLLTSGTTAVPKFMHRTNRFLIMLAEWGSPPHDVDVFMAFTPLSWVSGLHTLLIRPFGKRRRVVAAYFDAETTWKWIEQYQIQYILTSAHGLLCMMCCDKISNYDKSSLLAIFVAGTPLQGWHYEKFKQAAPAGCTLCHAYGMTEAVGALSLKIGMDNPGSSGTLVPGVSAKIIDHRTGKTISPHDLGELCVKQSGMFTGYYNNPEATKAVLDSDGWFHSGDLARFDENGELFVIDRLKEMIDLDGAKVSPSELEAILLQHPGIEQVAVVGKKVSNDAEHPAAFVVKTPGSNVTEAELVNFLRGQVEDDAKQLKGGVRFIQGMPRSTAGKIKRWELTEMLES